MKEGPPVVDVWLRGGGRGVICGSLTARANVSMLSAFITPISATCVVEMWHVLRSNNDVEDFGSYVGTEGTPLMHNYVGRLH